MRSTNSWTSWSGVAIVCVASNTAQHTSDVVRLLHRAGRELGLDLRPVDALCSSDQDEIRPGLPRTPDIDRAHEDALADDVKDQAITRPLLDVQEALHSEDAGGKRLQ